jgi:hypothetical protein
MSDVMNDWTVDTVRSRPRRASALGYLAVL